MKKRRINVRAIVWRNGKVLAVKHKDADTGVVAEYWALPGGGLDPMESLEQGVEREVFEELGVRTSVHSLMCVQQFPSKRDDFDEELEFFFRVEDSSEFDTVDFAKTSHGESELGDIAFVDPKKAYILPELLVEADLDALANTTTPVVVKNYL